MKALNDRRETISGVNLDEEAANMVKFQQLYSASSKIIQTGNQLFETLLAMVSR
jgi:flagellar hook-associated protein 1 FlgK